MNYLNEPSPFPEVLKEEEEEGEISKGGKGSSRGMLALPSKPADPVDLYKILKKARSDREKLAYTAQYVVRYPGDFGDLEARLDKYLNLMDYESSRRDFLSVNVWTESKPFFVHSKAFIFDMLILTRHFFFHFLCASVFLVQLLAAYGRTKAVQEGTSNLGYYSDLKAIQQKVG